MWFNRKQPYSHSCFCTPQLQHPVLLRPWKHHYLYLWENDHKRQIPSHHYYGNTWHLHGPQNRSMDLNAMLWKLLLHTTVGHILSVSYSVCKNLSHHPTYCFDIMHTAKTWKIKKFQDWNKDEQEITLFFLCPKCCFAYPTAPQRPTTVKDEAEQKTLGFSVRLQKAISINWNRSPVVRSEGAWGDWDDSLDPWWGMGGQKGRERIFESNYVERSPLSGKTGRAEDQAIR